MFQINWKTKSTLYKLFEFFRLKKILYFFQKYITKRSSIKIREIDKSWKFHSEAIKKNNITNLLEVGAGKSLEQNIYLSYFFKNKVKQTVIDINKMLDFDLFNAANEKIANILNLDPKKKVNNLEALKSSYNILYKAPHNLDDIIKNKQSFDMCISTTALEHFTLSDIENLLLNLKKILKKGGFISSAIDYSDHYSHTDKNIGPLNFLKYTQNNWAKYNNSYLYQNRLRHRDYEKLFIKHNYIIKDNVKGPKQEYQKEVSNEFDPYDQDIFILWGYYLVQNNLKIISDDI